MNQEFEEILNRLKEIEQNVKSNHDMLISIQRRARMTILFSLIKWTVILGLTFGTFYYTKPYIEQTMDLYDQVSGLTGGMKSQASSTQSVFDQFKSFFK